MIEPSETDIRVTEVVDAPVTQVWAVLAKTRMHAEIDGSGMVRVRPEHMQQTVRGLGAAAAGI